MGGIGGSGTRVIAGFLEELGVFLGADMGKARDNLWYALLFGRREVLVEDNARFETLAQLFFRQMSTPQPMNDAQIRLVDTLAAQHRIQHQPERLQTWAQSLKQHGQTGRPAPVWGWKVPYTHILIDRLLTLQPDLRYVHISRNGPDMAYSANQNQLLKWGPVLLNRNVTKGPRDALAFWVAVHQRMTRLAALYPDRIFHLDYDRMLHDPAGVLDGLFGFLGIALAPGQLDAFAAQIVAPETVGRHRAHDMSVFRPRDLAYVAQLDTVGTTAGATPPQQTPPNLKTAPQTASAQGALEIEILRTRKMRAGGQHYRAYVGPPNQYDFMGATQFRLLTGLGLREEHRVLDIGCGSLRAGKFLLHYLLPDRYTGTEPNTWLWQNALETEIGADIARIKRPRILANPDFSPADIGPSGVDFIIAQSIYSHTGTAMLRQSIAAAAAVLAPGGQFLFTAILRDMPNTANIPRGDQAEGWIYPGCVTFDEDEVQAICAPAGLQAQRLPWFHPRQTWFRAVADRARRLTPQMITDMGSGRPLFDPRFDPR
ncbi:sulfotransferase family protein [Puniceibacterium sp. IMCC21224]|nr:sulfotransferase family protein [Puniceibacterium sp. IMCC21224]